MRRRIGAGRWSDPMLQQRMTALLAFVMPAESGAFRRHVLERFGVAARRLEPRDSRRQLEQQRQELPVSEPQQQQPDQQEQQHWVPGCPGPSSTGAPEGAPADPAAIPSGAMSSGAGKQRQRTARCKSGSGAFRKLRAVSVP